MSECDGGFIVERTDAGVGAIAYEVIRSHLTRRGESAAGRGLHFATSRGASSMALDVTGGPAIRQARMRWPEANATLAGDLASALGCRAWVWGREDLVGSEFVVGFSASGERVLDESLSWDDIPEDEDEESAFEGPIARLSGTLGSWEAAEGSAWVEVPLDQPFDASVLETHLLVHAVEPPRPPRGHAPFKVFLMQCVLADAKKLADAAKTDLGTVLWAAWEATRAGLAAELVDGTGNVLPLARASDAPRLDVAKPPPRLGEKRDMTPDLVAMHLPVAIAEEIRALANHGDAPYGRVASHAYLRARERLWRGDPK